VLLGMNAFCSQEMRSQMKSSQWLVSLVSVTVICWGAGACSSTSGDDDAAPGSAGAGKSGTGGSNNTNGGEPGNEAGSGTGGKNAGGVGAVGQAGDADGGTGAPVGSAGETSAAGDTGDAGSGPTCHANFKNDPKNCGRCGHDCGGGECSDSTCQLVAVLDPAPRSINRNVSLDVRNKVLIDQGSLYYWNYGYQPNSDFEYTILKASVVPTVPVSNGLPAVQTFPILASPIQGAAFNGGYLYYTIATGIGAPEVRRKLLNTNDGTGGGTPIFPLANGRIWRGIAFADGAWYVTGEVDTIMVDQIKSGIYKLVSGSAPTVVPGLGTLDNRVFDFTIVGGHLFWTEDDATTRAMLWTAPVAGGIPVKLADVTQFGGASVVGDVDGTYVYWTNHRHGGTLARCPIAHLDVDHIEPVATVNNSSEGLFVDAEYAYYQEDETLVTGKPIWRVTKAGGTPELLGELEGGFALVGVDDGFVYAQDFDNALYRVSKTP
jgi:hypothetical protein